MKIAPAFLMMNQNSSAKPNRTGTISTAFQFQPFLAVDQKVNQVSIPDIIEVPFKRQTFQEVTDELRKFLTVRSLNGSEIISRIESSFDASESSTLSLLEKEINANLSNSFSLDELFHQASSTSNVAGVLTLVKAIEHISAVHNVDLTSFISDLNSLMKQEFSSYNMNTTPQFSTMFQAIDRMIPNDKALLEGQILLENWAVSNDISSVQNMEKLLMINTQLLNVKTTPSTEKNIKSEILHHLFRDSPSTEIEKKLHTLIERTELQTLTFIFNKTVENLFSEEKTNIHLDDFDNHEQVMSVDVRSFSNQENLFRLNNQHEQKGTFQKSLHSFPLGIHQLRVEPGIDFSLIENEINKLLNLYTKRQPSTSDNNDSNDLKQLMVDFIERIKQIGENQSSNRMVSNKTFVQPQFNEQLMTGLQTLEKRLEQLLPLHSDNISKLISKLSKNLQTEFFDNKHISQKGNSGGNIPIFNNSMSHPKETSVDLPIHPQSFNFTEKIREETFTLQLDQFISKNQNNFYEQQKTEVTVRQEFTNQLVNAFKSSKFAQLPNGANRLVINLNPEHLGLLTVRLVQKNGEMIARIMASTESAKELLDHSLHQLKQAIPSIQVEIERFDVNTEQSAKSFKEDHSDQKEKHEREERQAQSEKERENEQSFLDSLKEVLNTTI